MVSWLHKGVHSSLTAGVSALDYSFSYDEKGRLSGSTLATGGSTIYQMTMGYNAAGGITSKASVRPGAHPLVDPNLDYELSYTYNPTKPHQLLSVSDAGPNGGLTRFTYDGVGNLMNMSGPSGAEELIWNELQQLSGVKNRNGIHHYVYDHSGERIMKSSINRSSVQVNDQTIDDIAYLEPYTLYVNPYFVVTSFHNGDRASKHYYMNTQRVATDISINYQGPPPPAAQGAQGTQTNPIGLSASFEQDINQVMQQFDAGEIAGDLAAHAIAIENYYPKAPAESESTNRILYWYHPDYLGSVDLVTDRNGLAYEFFLYTPWGEDMYHYNAGSSSFSSPYRFNGKEKDPETGYHYYGARYYKSKLSVWMSVDPLVHETLEPYIFTRNNPVTFVDPDGRMAVPPSTHTDEDGNVLAVYDDGDLGVYAHRNGTTKADIDASHSIDNTSAGGTRKGETLHTFSFVDGLELEKGNIIHRGKIDFSSTWAKEKVQSVLDNSYGIFHYGINARSGGNFDIKLDAVSEGLVGGIYNGSQIVNGIYASSRDAGNFAAGVKANNSIISNRFIVYGYGAYNAGNNTAKGAFFAIGSDLIIRLSGGYKGLLQSPDYGEDRQSALGIQSGIRNSNWFD